MDFPRQGYDLLTHVDCLHDMGDPVGGARHVGEVLAQEGTWMATFVVRNSGRFAWSH